MGLHIWTTFRSFPNAMVVGLPCKVGQPGSATSPSCTRYRSLGAPCFLGRSAFPSIHHHRRILQRQPCARFFVGVVASKASQDRSSLPGSVGGSATISGSLPETGQPMGG